MHAPISLPCCWELHGDILWDRGHLGDPKKFLCAASLGMVSGELPC